MVRSTEEVKSTATSHTKVNGREQHEYHQEELLMNNGIRLTRLHTGHSKMMIGVGDENDE
jgi:hypothetical protein